MTVWVPEARFDLATREAMRLHAHQVRKGAGTPYIGHLLSVAGLVIEFGGDQEQAIAALLHDSIEDCGVSPCWLADTFGGRVARIVQACTDTDANPKPAWRLRKEAYLASLAGKQPDELLVSCCDKLHNARSIVTDLGTHGLEVFARFTGKMGGTLWYYRALAGAFQELLPGPAARELDETVERMESFT